jgi:hypothetical protein
MAKLAFLSLLVVSLLVSVTAAAETSARPLRQTELLALVAGNALPEKHRERNSHARRRFPHG